MIIQPLSGGCPSTRATQLCGQHTRSRRRRGEIQMKSGNRENWRFSILQWRLKSFSILFWTRWLRRLPMTRTQPAMCQRTCGGRTCFDFFSCFFREDLIWFLNFFREGLSYFLFFREDLFCFFFNPFFREDLFIHYLFREELFYQFFKGGPFFLLLGNTFFYLIYLII